VCKGNKDKRRTSQYADREISAPARGLVRPTGTSLAVIYRGGRPDEGKRAEKKKGDRAQATRLSRKKGKYPNVLAYSGGSQGTSRGGSRVVG